MPPHTFHLHRGQCFQPCPCRGSRVQETTKLQASLEHYTMPLLLCSCSPPWATARHTTASRSFGLVSQGSGPLYVTPWLQPIFGIQSRGPKPSVPPTAHHGFFPVVPEGQDLCGGSTHFHFPWFMCRLLQEQGRRRRRRSSSFSW